MAKAAHKRSHRVKGWRKRAPHIPSERRALLSRCGKKAFLQPTKLKFPVMAKHGRCVVDCEGLRVAYGRARQFRHSAIASKAHRKAVAAKCAWVR